MHSSIIAWKILRTEEPGGVTKESDMTERTHTHTHTTPLDGFPGGLVVKNPLAKQEAQV